MTTDSKRLEEKHKKVNWLEVALESLQRVVDGQRDECVLAEYSATALLSHIETLQQERDALDTENTELRSAVGELDGERKSRQTELLNTRAERDRWSELAGKHAQKVASLERVREAVEKFRKYRPANFKTLAIYDDMRVELDRHEREHPKEAGGKKVEDQG